MSRIVIRSLPVFLLAMIFFSACNKDEDENKDVNLTLRFYHHVDNVPLSFNSFQYQNSFGNVYSVETLRYFISDFRLEQADGEEIFIDDEHYVDGKDASTMDFQTGVKVPPGNYSGISFVFGLNEAKNVPGRFPDLPESNMEWPIAMGPGYHYMKLEGKIDNDGSIQNFQAHTGATDGNQNFIEIVLPDPFFIAEGNNISITIGMNINQWWEQPNTFDLNNITSIMGNQEIQQKLHDNGLSVFTLISAE